MLPSSRPYTSPSSVQDLVIQRQPRSPLKEEGVSLTRDSMRLFLPSSLTNSRIDELCNSKNHQDHTISPTSVITLNKIIEPMEITRTQVAFKRQTLKPRVGEQYQYQHHNQQHQQLQSKKPNQLQLQLQQHQLQHDQLQKKQQQREVEFACLYPRDDQQSCVRFNPSLSVYDNFQYYDYNDDVHDNSPEITDEKTARLNKETNCCKLFWLDRARRCWYSKEELKILKNERKEIVRTLKKVNFDVRSIDTSIHELRGFECYLSPTIIGTTQRKRREALESVLNEQQRQQQSLGGKRNVESLQLVSSRASEWFRTRAFQNAEKDAKEARRLCLNHPEVMRMMEFFKASSRESNTTRTTEGIVHKQQGIAEENISMVCEVFHESFSLMDLDDDDVAGDGSGNDSTLNFWANSSWTKDLMEE